jgi:hypothetical protein
LEQLGNEASAVCDTIADTRSRERTEGAIEGHQPRGAQIVVVEANRLISLHRERGDSEGEDSCSLLHDLSQLVD